MPANTNQNKAKNKRTPMSEVRAKPVPQPKAKPVQAARKDISLAREPESTYIMRMEKRPVLDSRSRWLDEAVANKIPPEIAIVRTGFSVTQILDRYKISALERPELVEKLTKIKDSNPN